MSRAAPPRRLLATLAVLAAGVAVLAPATAAAASGSGPLAGTWTSTDTDGSHQTLDITGSGNRVYSMVYVDDSATGACGGDPARFSGPGFVDGDSVLMVGTLVCQPRGNPLKGRLEVSFQHDAEADTLVDDFDIVWSRAG